jgi:hypothetical protein
LGINSTSLLFEQRQEEINEKIEACQKKLDDYNVQLEALSKKEEVSEEDQAQFDYILREISSITEEIESLLNLI